MIYQELNSQYTKSAGSVASHPHNAKARPLGDVLAREGGGYELILKRLPKENERVRITFNSTTPPGRRHLAALIETPFSDVRVEIGQIDIGGDATGDLHIFGDPGFPARLIF